MLMTPRVMAAHLHFLDRELAIEEATFINNSRLASHGADKHVKKHLKTLLGED